MFRHRFAIIAVNTVILCMNVVSGCSMEFHEDLEYLHDDAHRLDTYLARVEFAELGLDGQENDFGIALLGMVGPSGETLHPAVADNQLVARNAQDPERLLSGPELVDSALVVRQQREGGEVMEWFIYVTDVSQRERLSDEYGHETVYRLTYAPVSHPENEQYLCTGHPEAVFLFGEKYAPSSWRIANGSSDHQWLRIACYDDVLWTMKLASYDPGRAPSDPYQTSRAQRRATIQMLRADYCGSGVRWGRALPTILARNRLGWAAFSSMPTYPGMAPRLEAGWGEHGVTCLDTPRSREVYPREDIESACGWIIPTCTDGILARSEWTSWAL